MTRDIHIQPVLNGFLCFIGCQKVVFPSREALICELTHYLEDPQATEKRFLRNAINRDLLREPVSGPEPVPANPAPVMPILHQRPADETPIEPMRTPTDSINQQLREDCQRAQELLRNPAR